MELKKKQTLLKWVFLVKFGVVTEELVFVRYERLLKVCSIALVGKYTKLSDCYASVFKALEHSALAINYKLDLMVSIFLVFAFKDTLNLLLYHSMVTY